MHRLVFSMSARPLWCCWMCVCYQIWMSVKANIIVVCMVSAPILKAPTLVGVQVDMKEMELFVVVRNKV